MKIDFPARTALFVSCLTAVVAQGQTPHSEALHPRVGVMSEEVVREKFKSYGVDVVKLEPRDNKYIVHAQLEGKPVVLELDRLSGTLMQGGESLRMRPAAKAIPLAIKPNASRVPWVNRTIRFEKIGVDGIRLPAKPTHN